MNKKQLLKKIVRLSLQALEMIYYRIISIFYKTNNKYNNMWLISERGTESKDNGYIFFKYLRECHPEINVWYVIDSKYKKDFQKVEKYGNIIEYKSFEHKLAFLLCTNLISTHIGYVECWSYKLYKMLLDRKSKKNYTLLQHGIINHDLSDVYSKKCTKIDLFITSTHQEYESIKNKSVYGYEEYEVAKTGLARFDVWYKYIDSKNENKQILLMPTWRNNIVTPSYSKDIKIDDSVFKESEYFKKYNSLINNKILTNYLELNNIKLIFYPHYEIQPYLKYFVKSSSNIKIASKDEYDVQQLLVESNLLITDYSSVFFDFAYMKKPIIYYHFDEGHYKKGYFNHDKDGFGKIIKKEDLLIKEIINITENNYKLTKDYLDRVQKFYDIVDNHNCDRIYDEIIRMNLRKNK